MPAWVADAGSLTLALSVGRGWKTIALRGALSIATTGFTVPTTTVTGPAMVTPP